jgi:hypothetical protein
MDVVCLGYIIPKYGYRHCQNVIFRKCYSIVRSIFHIDKVFMLYARYQKYRIVPLAQPWLLETPSSR